MKVDKLKPAYYAIFLLIVILVTGTLGFMFIEGYSLIDAIFMTIITVTTVGFGEVHPLSFAGKIFTSILIVSSFGIFAFSASTLAQYIVSGVFRNYFKYSKVKKIIDQLHNHVIVVGYGRNGLQAIKELNQHHIPVVIVENREPKIKEIQQHPDLLYIDDDPSSDEVLLNAGIRRAKAIISVLPTDEENLFAVITARELNPKITIISRAINFNTIKKLRTAGASHVIMPDKISGQQMANMIAQPDTVEFMEYLMHDKTKDAILNQVSCKELAELSNATISFFRIDEKVNIIGLKRADGSYILNPSSDVVLEQSDLLFVLGTPKDIDSFKQQVRTKLSTKI